MDPYVNPQTLPQTKNSRSSFLKWGLLSLLGLALLIGVLIAKGYLKLPFSVSLQSKLQPSTKPSSPLEKIIVNCPTVENLCSQAQVLKLNLPQNKQKYDGLGWKLPKDTAIKAVFDGFFKQQEIFGASQSARIITLTSASGRYEARYIFAPANKLSVIEQRLFENGIEVKSNDVLVIAPGIQLPRPGQTEINLQFYVIDKTANGKTVELQPEDLGKLNLP